MRNGTFAHTQDQLIQGCFGENQTPDTGTSEMVSTVCKTIV